MSSKVSLELMEALRSSLPFIIPHAKVRELTMGLLAETTLSNLVTAKKGPPVHWAGRRRFYLRDEFVDWMIGHFSKEDDDEPSEERADS